MQIIIKKEGYSCVFLERHEPEDYTLFHTASTLCFQDKKPDEGPNIDKTNKQIRSKGSAHFWKSEFETPLKIPFVLQNDDGDIIGMATFAKSLWFPFFEGLHILTHHRGNNLSDLLYEGVLEYALEKTRWEKIMAAALLTNEPSLKQAARNAFQPNHCKTLHDGQKQQIFCLDLDEIRAARKTKHKHNRSINDLSSPPLDLVL